MSKPLISHGAPDEVFVMGDLGFEIDVSALISRINLAPREKLDIREGSTADLMDIGHSGDLMAARPGLAALPVEASKHLFQNRGSSFPWSQP